MMQSSSYDNKGFSSLETGKTEPRGDHNVFSVYVKRKNGSTMHNEEGDRGGPIQRVRAYFKRHLGDTKFGVHVLVCVFAISAWADMNAMWSELPLLVLEAPEGWNLPSYIIVISQVANVGPLIFVLVAILMVKSKRKLEIPVSYGIIMSDIIAVILVSIFWNNNSYVAGQERSTALLALNFVFALGDCTSSITFYAFMSSMKKEYMATLFFGEGLSGMLPAFIALAQGISTINCVHGTKSENATYPNGTEYNKILPNVYPQFGEARFTVQAYFLIIGGILVFSFIAFALLNTLPYCKSEMVTDTDSDDVKLNSKRNAPLSKATSTSYEFGSEDLGKSYEKPVSSKLRNILRFPEKFRPWEFIIYMAITIIINMTLTTFLATIQSYSTLPYGLNAYHLSTNLAQIANPIACFFALFLLATNLSVISVVFLLGEAVAVLIIYIAVKSPTPPLHENDGGEVFIVWLWVLVTLLLVYGKVCVAGVMRKSGRSALIWFGTFTQVGSLIGAMTGFVLVNEYAVFTSAPYC